MLDPHKACPFGWAVPRVGYKPAQVRDEVRTMVAWAKKTWESNFPEREGYEIHVESPAGRGHGVQLRVQRGDFRAEVAIENGLAVSRRRPSGQLHVRMFGRAESTVVKRTESRTSSFAMGGRHLGAALGFVAAVVLPPVPVAGMVLLGVMFWAVLILASTITAGALGGWLGERLAETAKLRASRDATGDARLQHDLRRWKAISRQLAARRTALAEGSVAGQPFRSLRAHPSAW